MEKFNWNSISLALVLLEHEGRNWTWYPLNWREFKDTTCHLLHRQSITNSHTEWIKDPCFACYVDRETRLANYACCFWHLGRLVAIKYAWRTEIFLIPLVITGMVSFRTDATSNSGMNISNAAHQRMTRSSRACFRPGGLRRGSVEIESQRSTDIAVKVNTLAATATPGEENNRI